MDGTIIFDPLGELIKMKAEIDRTLESVLEEQETQSIVDDRENPQQ